MQYHYSPSMKPHPSMKITIAPDVKRAFSGQLITIIPALIKQGFRINTAAIIDHSTCLAYPGESALQILSALKDVEKKGGLTKQKKEELLEERIEQSGYPKSVMKLIMGKRGILRCTTLINGAGGNWSVANEYVEILHYLKRRKQGIFRRRKSELLTMATARAASASADIFCSTSPKCRHGLEKTKFMWHAGSMPEHSDEEIKRYNFLYIEELIQLALFAVDEEKEMARESLLSFVKYVEGVTRKSIIEEGNGVDSVISKLQKDEDVRALIGEVLFSERISHKVGEGEKMINAQRVVEQAEIKNFFITEALPGTDLTFIDQQLLDTGDVKRTGKELHEMGMMHHIYSTLFELRMSFERVTGIREGKLPTLNIDKFFVVSMIDEILSCGFSLDFDDDGTLNPECISHLSDGWRQVIHDTIRALKVRGLGF
jgi:hypothetical protein